MRFLQAIEVDAGAIAISAPTGSRTWAELEDNIFRAGHALRESGLTQGDRFGILSINRPEFLELVIAAVVSGLQIVPINWHFTADEVSYLLSDSGSRLLVTDTDHAETASTAAEDAGVSTLVGLDTIYASWIADRSPAWPNDQGPGGIMLYTSGTTGRPKGVYREPQVSSPVVDLLPGWRAFGKWYGMRDSGCHLVVGPMYHGAPLAFALYALLLGQSVVLTERFDATECLELLTDHAVTSTHMVPTHFVRLLRLDDEARACFDPSHLETVMHGAAPCPTWVKRAMIDWWGPVIYEYYGSSEGVGPTIVSSSEWLERPGTVGKPYPGVEVSVIDTDTGAELGPGEVGTLYFTSTLGPPRYLNDEEKSKSIALDDGRFTSGDMGYVDENGYVFLADREIDLIISGGVNIYPAEVESVLGQHPDVLDCAVFGIPDDEWGEQVKAAVELVDGNRPDPQMLIAWCRDRLANYKAPKSIDIHDSLPRTDTGKLRKRALRDAYWAGRERAI